jgi:hypothetical protein
LGVSQVFGVEMSERSQNSEWDVRNTA